MLVIRINFLVTLKKAVKVTVISEILLLIVLALRSSYRIFLDIVRYYPMEQHDPDERILNVNYAVLPESGPNMIFLK